MNTVGIDLLTIILSFFEGFALITSPCILPILPIFLAGSLTSSKKRPLGIISGFTLTFAIVAYFSRQFVRYSGIDLNILRYASYAILLLLGIVMLSSYLSKLFSRLTQHVAEIGARYANMQKSREGFLGGFMLGGLVAVVWTPCAGPILATVIVQTVLQETNLASFFTLLAFAFGAAMPMFIIAFYGAQLMASFHFFKISTTFFRQLLGAVIIASVAYMLIQENGFTAYTAKQSTIKTATFLQKGLWRTYSAPPIQGIEAWINSPPLALTNLKGKVVLIDFWTYSCINCIRTLPYVSDWYRKYRDHGLVIIGVHTPEFDFEKNLTNIKNAVNRYGIQYPIAVDNQFMTWRSFSNHFWPAHYLINKNGDVVYEHFGEGDYDITENNIRFLLGIDALMPSTTNTYGDAFSGITPETYLGYARADKAVSPELIHDQITNYQFSKALPIHAWRLQGAWQAFSNYVISASSKASITLNFNARNVYIVMGNKSKEPINVDILLKDKGNYVMQSSITVDSHRLYKLLTFKKTTRGVLQLIANQPGLEIYTFTFGN